MVEMPDVGVLLLAVAVVALVVWFFWHTISTMLDYGRQLAEFFDSSSERLRRKLDYEAIHGRPPLWYRFLQGMIMTAFIAAVAALIWNEFRGD
jgi:hypothetical protein